MIISMFEFISHLVLSSELVNIVQKHERSEIRKWVGQSHDMHTFVKPPSRFHDLTNHSILTYTILYFLYKFN